MENTELRKYLSDDTVFNMINCKFISLQDQERKQINQYLLAVVEVLLNYMKSMDTLFNKTYKHITFCGSYYKNTKVWQPNEFDLNIVLDLPIDYSTIEFFSTRPAFVKLNVNNSQVYDSSRSNGLANKEKRFFSTLVSNGFLDPNKFRNWIEGIISKVFNRLPISNGTHILDVSHNNMSFRAAVKTRKSGPAFTLQIHILKIDKKIDVDLVPTLKFNIIAIRKFISKFDKLQNCQNRECFVIPVPVRDKDASLIEDLHWRFSFCLQENEMLRRYGRVKLIIRQMKKLRDTQNWKSMASYYIETLFYNELTELESDIDKMPATYFFFKMLKVLHEACKRHEIRYFWNENYNLLERIGKVKMQNIADCLNMIIKNIERNLTDKFILASYILKSEELSLLKEICNSNGNSDSKGIAGEQHVERKDKDDPNQWKCTFI